MPDLDIEITDKNGIKLKTKDKYCTGDINVKVSDSLLGVDEELIYLDLLTTKYGGAS